MPWEEGANYIRSGHRNPDEFEKDSLRTITLSEEEGIKAVIGKPKGQDTTEVQSYLFDKDEWTLEKAKAWFKEHEVQRVREHVSVLLPFQIMQKITDKPLKIRGVATTSGIDRNFYILTPEELQKFAEKLVAAPVYLEHVSAMNAVGKVIRTEWDPESNTLFYEAEIYDEETQRKIRKGLINHVSIAANYETIDILDGKVPHDLYDAELSLVAVPAISGTSIQVMQKLQQQMDQEFILLPIRDVHGFLPDFFTLGWRDLAAGIQTIKGRLREKPEAEEDFAFLFLKAKGWTREQADIWVKEHAQTGPIGVQVSPAPSNATESSSMEEKEIKEKFEKFEEKLERISQHLKVPKPQTIPQILQSIDSKLTSLDKRLSKIERANEETEAAVDLTVEEIKQKIADLTSQKASLTEKLEDATEEEKTQLQQQIDALDLEIQALEKALAAKTAAPTGEGAEGGVEQKLGRAIIVPQEPEGDQGLALKDLSLREVMEGQQ
ncbi:hypothetical protein E3J74_05935 [Candidatus Bathyarchaeota archaeon]|nr:MAG: hypothetical protein E3J74_05935 [Candidatus Bathyarchaeota archaeon]